MAGFLLVLWHFNLEEVPITHKYLINLTYVKEVWCGRQDNDPLEMSMYILIPKTCEYCTC